MRRSSPASRRLVSLVAPLSAGLLVTAALLSGCSQPAPAATGGGGVSVVTSTNVFASIVSQIGGDAVTVHALIDDPTADPHSFEVSAQDQVAVATASLVVANGGGYDDFVQQMVEATDKPPTLLLAVDQAQPPVDPTVNEHVFYSPATMERLGAAIAASLSKLDPAHADTYAANAAAFSSSVDLLIRQSAGIAQNAGGATAIMTEPVAGDLLAAAGVGDVTPAGFSAAIEQENDPAPADIAAVDQLLAGGTVAMLIYNSQTAGPVVEKVRQAAEQHGVAVIAVTETLPKGQDYQSWISSTLTKISDAIGDRT